MPCPKWNDDWIAHLYGELDEDDARAAAAHLDSCASCRETLAGLDLSRTLLREHAPPLPLAPRVVVLEPRRFRHPAWGFAAGMAAAAALFAVALLLRPEAPGAPVANPEVEARLARLEERNAELEKLASSNAWLTRQQLDQELDGVMDRIDVARAKDFEFLLGEITAAEWRSGKRIVNSNDALLQTMLASNPRFSEQ